MMNNCKHPHIISLPGAVNWHCADCKKSTVQWPESYVLHNESKLVTYSTFVVSGHIFGERLITGE